MPTLSAAAVDRSSLSTLPNTRLQFQKNDDESSNCKFLFCVFFVFPFLHTSALFAAVEFGQVEKARAILEDNEVDINR